MYKKNLNQEAEIQNRARNSYKKVLKSSAARAKAAPFLTAGRTAGRWIPTSLPLNPTRQSVTISEVQPHECSRNRDGFLIDKSHSQPNNT